VRYRRYTLEKESNYCQEGGELKRTWLRSRSWCIFPAKLTTNPESKEEKEKSKR
jgi:hypothetical protein